MKGKIALGAVLVAVVVYLAFIRVMRHREAIRRLEAPLSGLVCAMTLDNCN